MAAGWMRTLFPGGANEDKGQEGKKRSAEGGLSLLAIKQTWKKKKKIKQDVINYFPFPLLTKKIKIPNLIFPLSDVIVSE